MSQNFDVENWCSEEAGSVILEIEPGATQRRQARSRTWCLTLNNPTKHGFQNHLSLITIMEIYNPIAYIFQLEIGKEDGGTEHYQGVFHWENQISFSTLRKINSAMHWEPTRWALDAQHYCQKLEGRIDGPWSKNVEIIHPKINIEIEKLYEWQKKIDSLINEIPNDRTILWIYDTIGGKGKTKFSRYLVQKYNACYVSGKSNDIKHVIAKSKIKPKIVIFDIVRSQEGKISYEAIEAIKNGIFMSGKYESETIIMDPPHVVCFANFPPEINKLSKDRWKIIRLL